MRRRGDSRPSSTFGATFDIAESATADAIHGKRPLTETDASPQSALVDSDAFPSDLAKRENVRVFALSRACSG
ncbi:hypothetical protein BE04_15280 [Sorangium cellulosum]|uniref:Uncharacterized protein n=2 Tax=Sorangium cellulosum TaxID=56 RepID=A0A150NYC4_SORCE|nr:hypothetical protein SCE1572_38330 [Sorangium cellulosum So0157-2]KYF46776.1 hypothetical protein BE04_15280 [Sorangium cellulosum]